MENSSSPTHYYESFMRPAELELTQRFLKDGYVIVPAEDKAGLDRIQKALADFAAQYLKIDPPSNPEKFLNEIHSKISIEKLNELRLFVFDSFNRSTWARSTYYSVARSTLDVLVGNELAMQKRVNLSIQLPNDDSSLLPLHSDCWSGDSPFETVLWIPLVSCFKTKSMFLLPPEKDKDFNQRFGEFATKSAEDLYKAVEPHLKWLEVPYGHVLVFSHTYMHGNRVNRESETRWSMNCRFKSVFSPFWDKRVGEFFEPITIRALSRIGMDYKLPGGFHE